VKLHDHISKALEDYQVY